MIQSAERTPLGALRSSCVGVLLALESVPRIHVVVVVVEAKRFFITFSIIVSRLFLLGDDACLIVWCFKFELDFHNTN